MFRICARPCLFVCGVLCSLLFFVCLIFVFINWCAYCLLVCYLCWCVVRDFVNSIYLVLTCCLIGWCVFFLYTFVVLISATIVALFVFVSLMLFDVFFSGERFALFVWCVFYIISCSFICRVMFVCFGFIVVKVLFVFRDTLSLHIMV